MRLSEAIEALCLATQTDGRSPRTVEAYREKLAGLLAFVGDVDVATITTNDLRRYVAEMMLHLSPFTVQSRTASMRRLFSWLVQEEVLEHNPAARVRGPRPRRQAPKAVRPADVVLLLQGTSRGRLIDLRDRALILFLADTGCRAGGVVGLRRRDLDLDRGIARVCEKGDKWRSVFYGEETCEALRDWLTFRPPAADALVFVSRGPKPHRALTPNGLRQMLIRRGKAAGCTGPVNPHAFRHGFARAYLANGGDLATCSALMGHSSIHVTAAFYAVFAGSELRELHRKHSPMMAIMEAVDG